MTVGLDGVSGVIRRPNLVGALVGKASAVVKISSQSAASRAKHLRDFDSLARLLGPTDRAAANLGKAEVRLLRRLVAGPGSQSSVPRRSGRCSAETLRDSAPR